LLRLTRRGHEAEQELSFYYGSILKSMIYIYLLPLGSPHQFVMMAIKSFFLFSDTISTILIGMT